MKICVLGRGASLNKLHLFEKMYFDDVFINNNFNRELDNNKNIFNFLQGKQVTHFINRELISLLETKWYQNLNMKMVLNITGLECYQSSVRAKLIRDGYDARCLRGPMITESIDGKGGYPTTGILSVVYAVKMMEATDVHIMGIDFYDANYYDEKAGMNKDSSVLPRQVEKGKKMKEFLKEFIIKNPKVNFTIVTESKERWILDNVKYL